VIKDAPKEAWQEGATGRPRYLTIFAHCYKLIDPYGQTITLSAGTPLSASAYVCADALL